MTCFYVHRQISFATEGFATYVAGVGIGRMFLLFMVYKVVLGGKLHATSLAQNFFVVSSMHLLDVRVESESGVQHLLANVALKVFIKLTMDLMFMFNTIVNLPAINKLVHEC